MMETYKKKPWVNPVTNLGEQIEHMTYDMKLGWPHKWQAKKIPAKNTFENKCFKKYQSQPGLIFQIYDSGHGTRVTPLKANLKK
jgi:hypothetical protein